MARRFGRLLIWFNWRRYFGACIYLSHKLGGVIMTKNEFMQLCAAACIDPAIALENDNVTAAIRAGDVEQVQFLLANEF
jgi:hypothetical protein